MNPESFRSHLHHTTTADEEHLPVADLVLVFDEFADGHLAGRFGGAEKIEPGFVRKLAAFAAVDALVGEDAVFPVRFSATGERDDVIDVERRPVTELREAAILTATTIAMEHGVAYCL